MPRTRNGGNKKHGDEAGHAIERTERSSPGSGEDDADEAADLQPDEVEGGDTAR
jgi:hypothetical protein